MNDVKELCELALEVPAPPLPSADFVVAVARRETRRRRLLAATGSALAVMTIAAAIGFAAVDRPAGPVTAQPTWSLTFEAPAPLPLPVAPSAEAAHDHSHKIAPLLLGALPNAYVSAVDFISIDAPASTWRIEDTNGHYVSTTRIVVTDGDRYGALSAVFVVKGAAPTAGLCDAAMSAWLAARIGPADTDCQVTVINGVPVRIASGDDGGYGRFYIALRLLNGGLLAVVSQQGVRPHWPLSPATPFPMPKPSNADQLWLPGPPLTRMQVAALVANPELMPN